MELAWKGEGVNEKGILVKTLEPLPKSVKTGDILVEVDPRYYRPTEVDILIGDATKAKENLGWQTRVKIEELVKIMAQTDWEKVQRRGF